jgi:hypothetical protein
MNWISVKDRLPEKGQRVLVHREVNKGQELLSYSICDGSILKHSKPETTFWMSLPEPPNN